jgi:hypothetical protein
MDYRKGSPLGHVERSLDEPCGMLHLRSARERTMTVVQARLFLLVNTQRDYFLSGSTRSSSWRGAQLEAVRYRPCAQHTFERKLEGKMM